MAGQTEETQLSDELSDVIVTTHMILKRKSEEVLSEENLTRPQFQALRFVAETGVTPMKGISNRMCVTPPNITGIVDRLESKGLVRRKAREGDKRATIIELTPKGVAVQRRVSSRYKEFVQDALKVFTAEEQRTLSALLLKLQEEVRKSGG
jgi:DNA-binding MarR family transcriptional regulator